jgi:glycosyltransferase involved in cell wall biosynthesis
VSRGNALILVENLSVPLDRRVWQECRSLVRNGFDVSVICPQGTTQDREPTVDIDGVHIHRYALRPATLGPGGYAREYATALWRTHRIASRLRKSRPFDLVHACNPPDLLLPAMKGLKRRGAAFIFDQHDLGPELYESRFNRGRDLLYRVTLAAERWTYKLADVVIATNESYRKVAVERGHKRPEDVFVVRSAPDLSAFGPVEPSPSLRRGKQHLLAYLGVMGPQDGVDHALRSLERLSRIRDDWHAIFIGAGDVHANMRQLASQLGLADHVEFPGRLPNDEVMRILSTADVCLAPDPLTPLNDVSTMNKIVEYMAVGRPVVSYDLTEARVSAGEAALYAHPNDPLSFGECINTLLDNDDLRERMGQLGRARVEHELSWQQSETQLLSAYDRALALRKRRSRPRDSAP